MLAVVPRNMPRRRRRPNLGPSWSYIQFIYGPWALFLDTKTRTHLTCFPCVIAHASTFFPAPSTFAGYASASAGTWTTKCSTDLCACLAWHPVFCRFCSYLDQAYGCLQKQCALITSEPRAAQAAIRSLLNQPWNLLRGSASLHPGISAMPLTTSSSLRPFTLLPRS